MALVKIKVGDIITISNEKNVEDKEYPFYGININKEFMPSVANTDNVDRKKYKIMRKNRFVFSGMQTGRDECIRIGMFDKDEPVLVSPAYTTFEVTNDKVLPTYLFMKFKSKEMDRYGSFLSDSSVRANLDWDRFCDIELEIPSIEIQKKYVDIYEGLLSNLHSYEKGLDDLKLVCDGYIEDLMKRYPLIELSKFIKQRNDTNLDLKFKLEDVVGVSAEKKIIPTKADASKNDISKFVLVKPNDFIYNPRNGIAVGLNETNQTKIISWNNTCFYISDEYKDKIDPRFLFMYLCRKEWDRKTKFLSWGSSTEVFTLNSLCETQIPLAPIEIQNDIIKIYNQRQNSLKYIENLKQKINGICPILIRGAILESLKQEN